jgi:hypothetical protein
VVIVVSHDASLSPVRSTFISVVAHERFGEGLITRNVFAAPLIFRNMKLGLRRS